MKTLSRQVPLLRRLRIPIIVLGFVIAIGLWWLFRPELLFINQRVNETPPDSIAALQPVFTGKLHPLVRTNDTHGRVNIVNRGGKLQLEINNFGSTEATSFVVALAPRVESANGRQTLGAITVTGHEVLPLPTGLNPAVDKAVLLMKDKRLVASAVLEPF